MKTSTVLRSLFTLLAALLMTAGGSAQHEVSKPGMGAPMPAKIQARPIEVVFQVPMDELEKRLPRAMTLYRAEPDDAAKSQRESVRALLGKSAHVELDDRSGGMFAADMSRLWAQPPEMAMESKARGEKDVRHGAEAFLRGIKGLPTEQKTVKRVSYDQMERIGKDGSRESRKTSASVTYRRLLDGYEVVGPGGKLKVFQDMKGEVAGYMRVWRKLIPEGRAQPVLTLREAVSRFKKDPLGRVLLSGVKQVVVEDVRAAYLELGMAESQNYVQPVYVFDCVAQLTAGKRVDKVPYVRYLQALVKPPEALWPEGKARESESRSKKLPAVGED